MLVEGFLDDAPSRLQAMREAIASSDARGVSDGAHALKGSCWALGAQQLGQLCHELEALAHEDDLAQAAVVLARVEEEYGRVDAAFRAELGW